MYKISEQPEGGKGNTGTVLKMKEAIKLAYYIRQIGIKDGKHLQFSSMSYVFHFTDSVALKILRHPHVQQKY